MSDGVLTVNNLIDFYNGHQAIAERAGASQLRYIHVRTDLDVKILDWLKKVRMLF